MCCLCPPVLGCDFQSLAAHPRGRAPPPPPPGGPAGRGMSIASEAPEHQTMAAAANEANKGAVLYLGHRAPRAPPPARLPAARQRQTSRQTLTHSLSPAPPPAVSRQPPRRASLAPPRPSQRLSASPPGSPACASPALPPNFNPHLPSRLALGPKGSPPPALPPSPPAADRRRRGAMRRRRRRGTSARS